MGEHITIAELTAGIIQNKTGADNYFEDSQNVANSGHDEKRKAEIREAIEETVNNGFRHYFDSLDAKIKPNKTGHWSTQSFKDLKGDNRVTNDENRINFSLKYGNDDFSEYKIMKNFINQKQAKNRTDDEMRSAKKWMLETLEILAKVQEPQLKPKSIKV